MACQNILGVISTSEYNSELEIIYAIESQYETTSFGDDTPITDTASITFTFTTLPPLEGAWVYSLDAQSTNFLIVFSRTPGGGVQVIELTDQLDAILQECEQALLSGADPFQPRFWIGWGGWCMKPIGHAMSVIIPGVV